MTTKEMAEVMLAYDRGEQIQSKSEIHYCFDNEPEWEDIKDNETPTWDWSSFSYRVKPKKKLVPFELVEEFIEAQRKHSMLVMDNEIDYFASINGEGSVFLNPLSGCTPMKKTNFEDLFTNYQFGDEAPCGKEVEE